MIELLVVIAIIAILAAILFPVFARAKAAAKGAACVSNLKQIGAAMTLYMNDYDGLFPHAVDPSDKYDPNLWASQPTFSSQIALMPEMHEALQPYVKSHEVFHCPSDTGSQVIDTHFPDRFVSSPSMFATFGTSYLFRTEIAFRFFTEDKFKLPANVNVMFDGAGHWHGAGRELEATDDGETIGNLLTGYRYNCLFGDMHVKSLSDGAMMQAWNVTLD
jgi:general secretion pathway protein G